MVCTSHYLNAVVGAEMTIQALTETHHNVNTIDYEQTFSCITITHCWKLRSLHKIPPMLENMLLNALVSNDTLPHGWVG